METREAPQSTASTPDRSDLKAAKDRSCPFCGQAFTSSSLGRHLDLYIKPKNPKPPDGVHDVNEIRKIRGGITRRQPRMSGKSGSEEHKSAHKRDHSGSLSRWDEDDGCGRGKRRRTSPDSPAWARVTDRDDVKSPTHAQEKENGMQTFFNTANWQATGVINDLPARSTNATPTVGSQAQRMREMRRDASGSRIERPEYGASDEMTKLQEAAEIGKAAEMALREVLGSLEAAERKVEPNQLWEDFDFFALPFPALCLTILPPPPTLFSSTPFAAAHTWALTPPQEKQYEALNRMLNERLTWMRNGKPGGVPDSTAFKYVVHLQGAWEHWQMMPQEEKTASWTLELARAFVGDKGRKNGLKLELEVAKQRNRHLEAEYERLSRCQLPREYLMHPPKTMPVRPDVMHEMKASHTKTAAAEAEYDAEALLEKWRAAIKSSARPTKNAASSWAPGAGQERYVETQKNTMRGDMIMNGTVFGIGGPMPRGAGPGYEPPDDVRTVVEGEAEPLVEEIDADAEADGAGEEAHMETEYGNGLAVTRLRGGRRRHDAAETNGIGKAARLYKEQ